MDKKSQITIEVGLDESNVPEKILWTANDGSGVKTQECKAMLLSFFDEKTKDTFKIDLWTKEMQTVEMDRLMFQTLRALSDTYFRATQNKELSNAMRQFVDYFGQQTEIIPKDDNPS